MKISDAYPSKYLKAGDLDGKTVTVTFKSVIREQVGMFSPEPQPVAYFHEFHKAMVLNKTNGKAIAKLYGDETSNWIGKQISLYATTVEFQGDAVEALRVKIFSPAPSKQETSWEKTIPSAREPGATTFIAPWETRSAVVHEAEEIATRGLGAFREWKARLGDAEFKELEPELDRLLIIARTADSALRAQGAINQ